MTSRIYVASLSDYNNGILFGNWFAPDDYGFNSEELTAAVTRMLGDSPAKRRGLGVAEEWAIHDYEGFEGIRISEYESFDTVVDLAKAIDSFGSAEAQAFGLWLENIVGDITYFSDPDDAVNRFQEAYIGEKSLEDYAYEYAEDVLGLTGAALDYFDCEKFGRDLELGGDITEYDGHLFNANW